MVLNMQNQVSLELDELRDATLKKLYAEKQMLEEEIAMYEEDHLECELHALEDVNTKIKNIEDNIEA